jgi:hypothetical protein
MDAEHRALYQAAREHYKIEMKQRGLMSQEIQELKADLKHIKRTGHLPANIFRILAMALEDDRPEDWLFMMARQCMCRDTLQLLCLHLFDAVTGFEPDFIVQAKQHFARCSYCVAQAKYTLQEEYELRRSTQEILKNATRQ